LKMAERTASLTAPEIVIRAPRDVEEMRIGVELQQQVWGYSEIETVPDQMFIVARESGGQVLFAFDQAKPVGFALAFAAVHDSQPYLHSHMVGVIPRYQNQGVGRLLKFAQRDDAVGRGIGLIEWTFDPLQTKNAHFNLVRLGAIIRRYIPNFYGQTSSPLHAGLPTDRLVAEWWVRSPRVEKVMAGKNPTPTSDAIRISLPSAIREICGTDAREAEIIQARVRRQFEQSFADGYRAVRFEINEQQADYILERYED
jgi:predicted GNAT superfamily acetyltransferase